MADDRKQKELQNECVKDFVSFSNVFEEAFNELKASLSDGETIRDLNNAEKLKINEFLKRNYQYYQKTSKFPIKFRKNIKTSIFQYLRKFIHCKVVIDDESDDETIELDIDCERELMRLINGIKKIDRTATPEVSEVWISRERIDLLSGDEDFWILLVGENELDLPTIIPIKLSKSLSEISITSFSPPLNQ